MEKLFSKLVGTPVCEESGFRPITGIRDVVMDPERGKVIALIVDRGRNLMISPMDVVSWGDVVRVHNAGDVIEANDVLRVQEVQDSGIAIFGNRVETVDGEVLGSVIDFSIEMSTLHLQKIYVAKGFLGLVRYSTRIIPAKKIVEILVDKIVVENNMQTVKEKAERELVDVAPVG